MTAPSVKDVDRRIGELRATVDRIAGNLVELDADVTRQTLDASPMLMGVTAAAWEGARAHLADLWQGQVALGDLLASLDQCRGSRAVVSRAALARLTSMLQGPSVVLVRRDAGQARRALTDGPEPVFTRTIDDAIVEMSAAYDSVMAVVNEVTAVWTETLPQLETLSANASALGEVVKRTGGRPPNDLVAARRAMADAEELARRDPLALSQDVIPAIAALVDSAAAALRDRESAQRELSDRLTLLAATIDADAAHLSALRNGRRSAADKIVVPDEEWKALDQADAVLSQVRFELERARRGFHEGAPDVRRLVIEVGRSSGQLRECVRRLDRTAGGGVGDRDELRGRLDAYRAKANAMGRSEDLVLEGIYRQASDVLYSAPCDLHRAEELVAAYQRAIRLGTGQEA